jgi:flagellar protein FlaG
MINLIPKSISQTDRAVGSESNQTRQVPTSGNLATSESKQSDRSPIGPQDSVVQGVDSVTLQNAVDKINNSVQNIQRDLSFSVDDESGFTVIKVIDRQSGKLIRQIPTEEVIAISNVLNDINPGSESEVLNERGLLFSNNA